MSDSSAERGEQDNGYSELLMGAAEERSFALYQAMHVKQKHLRLFEDRNQKGSW